MNKLTPNGFPMGFDPKSLMTRAQFYGYLVRAIAVSEHNWIKNNPNTRLDTKTLTEWTEQILPEIKVRLMCNLATSIHNHAETT